MKDTTKEILPGLLRFWGLDNFESDRNISPSSISEVICLDRGNNFSNDLNSKICFDNYSLRNAAVCYTWDIFLGFTFAKERKKYWYADNVETQSENIFLNIFEKENIFVIAFGMSVK